MDVDGISIARATAIANASVVSGAVDPETGHLILTTGGGATMDAGNVTPDIPEDTLVIAPPGDYSSDKVIEASDPRNVRPGMVVMVFDDADYAGWVKLRGQAVLRAGTYAALFAKWGTTFGVGDGSTTFNLPDPTNKFPRGATADGQMGTGGGSSTKAVPVHTHSVPAHGHADTFATSGPDGLVAREPSGGPENAAGGSHQHTVTGSVTNAAAATTGAASGSAFDVMNPFLMVNFLAKI